MTKPSLPEETATALTALFNALTLALTEEEDSDDRVPLYLDLNVGDGQRMRAALKDVLDGVVAQTRVYRCKFCKDRGRRDEAQGGQNNVSKQ